MRPFGTAMNPQPLNHDLRFFESMKHLSIQQLASKLSIK
jgi:hypothetical protein